MDPSRKRAIRLTVALTAALLLATALVYVSFNSGRDEYTAAQLLQKAKPGGQYVLAGTVENGTVQRKNGTLKFRVLAPNQRTSVPVTYSGVVPDPFAEGRAVMVNVTDQNGSFVGQQNSLTTKCPSKYQAASGAAVS
jgi:cytochrome c-type biogenesis protein CcmE